MSEGKKHPPIGAPCRTAAKSANAGVLLHSIQYWMPKATIVRAKTRWVANSAEDWCKQTGLTIPQYRRAIAQLRNIGLVVTEQHLFAGKNVTYVRLTSKAYDALGKDAPPEVTELDSPGNAKSAQTKVLETAQLLIHDKPAETTTEETTASVTPAPEANPVLIKKSNGQKLLSENSKQKGHKQLQSLENGKIVHATTPSVVLENVWRQAWKELDPDYVLPNFTVKQRSQLKHIAAVVPNGAAEKTIRACLKDWTRFGDTARSDAGAFPVPAKPTIEFLAKYIEVAINFAISMAKIAAKLEAYEKAKAVDAAAQPMVSAPFTAPNAMPTSHEELLKIMKEP